MHGPETLDRDILLIRELEALDRDTLRIPLREPRDEQHVGGGPPLLLPRCSAARVGSAIRLRAAPYEDESVDCRSIKSLLRCARRLGQPSTSDPSPLLQARPRAPT